MLCAGNTYKKQKRNFERIPVILACFLWKKVAFTMENQVDKCGKIKEKLLKSKANMWKTQWKV